MKLMRSRRPWIAAAALALFLVLMLVGFYTYARSQAGSDVDFRYTFENRSYFNGLTFTIYAFYFANLLVLPVFIASEGAAQIAGETAHGTLRLLLTRPVSKTRVFFVKLAVTASYATLLTGVFLAVCLLVGLVFVGWGDLDLYSGVLQMTSRHQHLDQGVALRRFALAWPAASLSLFTTLALGTLLSTCARSTVNAASAAISLYLIMHVISGVHFFERLRPLLFTSYSAYWRGLFQERVAWEELARDGAKLCGYALLFLVIAHRRFCRREEL